MIRFSVAQKNRSSEIFGNVSVAWFSAGVISPFFLHAPLNSLDLIINFFVSLVISIAFFIVALFFAVDSK